MRLLLFKRLCARLAVPATVLAGFVALMPSMALAHEVSPMRVFLVPSEGRGQATLAINNTRSEALPLEIKAVTRHVAEDGSETFEDAPDAFIIFPQQVEVEPLTTQALRIQFTGPPPVDAAQAYVIQVNEVPVVPEGFSGVRFSYNFGVAVYVEPARASDRLSVLSTEQTGEGVRLVVRNSGAKYGVFHLNRLTLSWGDQQLELAGEELSARIDNPLIPPLMDRTIEISVPELPAGQTVSAVLRSQ